MYQCIRSFEDSHCYSTLPVVQQSTVVHVLARLSSSSSQGGPQQLLALRRALEEELHGSRQHGQLHMVLLVGKALGTGF